MCRAEKGNDCHLKTGGSEIRYLSCSYCSRNVVSCLPRLVRPVSRLSHFHCEYTRRRPRLHKIPYSSHTAVTNFPPNHHPFATASTFFGDTLIFLYPLVCDQNDYKTPCFSFRRFIKTEDFIPYSRRPTQLRSSKYSEEPSLQIYFSPSLISNNYGA